MDLPSLVSSTNNPIRFSETSWLTEDSFDSTDLATPLDASPLPPPSNIFSIINIVNDDPLPNPKGYNAIASTYTRPRAQTSPRPMSASIIQSIPQQITTVHDNTESNLKKNKLWPKLKRMIMMPNTSTSPNSKEEQDKYAGQDKAKRWLSRNRARVGPQR
ncbi:uncharacterized protein B0P05DRAFT_551649 [Gilbertella persicaria]|uniref:Uncharacterized protein n=1 Tax=Rhizopus stolonifer TaxID=4846 RepID=A0A367KUT2_RHIST|nr:uncharacterized protein B0P05DRAFT_551649 [Gilbertella persicaria]KAI8069127.1 hypothetical protein B0P05DRAFT_551649 [Gilbertella persicaria]RCI05958.1 hypothetical protein CU098_013423 [Rhizopus stolonifer]